jgi:hypothetical protein
MVREDVIEDMEKAREILSTTDCSIVVVKNGTILTKKQGDGIKPILEAIEELGQDMKGSIIGDKILGKASALLCVYSEASGVYSKQATKIAIAVLIRAGIPGQTDEMIPYIKNRNGDGLCPFEKMLSDTDSPEEAYEILKKTLNEIQ